MTNREKFTEIFGCEIAQRDTGEAIPGHCKILIASDNHFNEWLRQEYIPSAHPTDRNGLEQTGTDLISRQAAINSPFKMVSDGLEWVPVYHLRELPSAQPEIIRCKDCKQFRRWIDTDICFCDITESERLDNDFCSRAERRTDG